MLADRRSAGGQRPLRGMAVIVPFAGHRPFPPDVQGAQGVDLAGLALGDNHPVLLLHRRVGCGGFHPAKLQRLPLVLVQVGEHLGSLDRFGGKANRLPAPYRSSSLRNRRAVLGYQQARYAVVGAHPVNITLNNLDAGGLPRLYCRLQVCDGRLFQAKPVLAHNHTFHQFNCCSAKAAVELPKVSK